MTSWSAFDGEMTILTDEKENCVAIVSRPLFRKRGDPEEYMAYWRGDGTRWVIDGIARRIPDHDTTYKTVKAAQTMCERFAVAVERGSVGKF